MKKLSRSVILFSAVVLALSACSYSVPQGYDGRIMVLSLSSDGHYAVSTDISKHVVLWDLQNHSYKIIANKANIYSAYFIKNTNDFMYQSNKNNEVYVINTDGKIVKQFNPGFPTYGQVMTTDLSTYVASDVNYQLYKINNSQKEQFFYYYCGQNYKDETPPPSSKPYGCNSFEGSGKLLNLSLTNHDSNLLTSGSSNTYYWDVKNGNLIYHFTQLPGPSYATINPEQSYFIIGNDGIGVLKCDSKTGYCPHFSLLGPSINNNAPKVEGVSSYNLNAIKFIDTQDYLIFYSGIPNYYPYAALYNINSPIISHNNGSYYTITPIKYLPLINSNDSNPIYPALQDAVRDQAIDTSPSAHILVMAQQNGNGILVYQYDPATQTLKQVWTANVN